MNQHHKSVSLATGIFFIHQKVVDQFWSIWDQVIKISGRNKSKLEHMRTAHIYVFVLNVTLFSMNTLRYIFCLYFESTALKRQFIHPSPALLKHTQTLTCR